jgi:isopropylmalate/homocitrate/citramalate synthase
MTARWSASVGRTCELTLHFHNTRGMGLANVLAAMRRRRADRFDASLGGLGGCPYAPGAKRQRVQRRRHRACAGR